MKTLRISGLGVLFGFCFFAIINAGEMEEGQEDTTPASEAPKISDGLRECPLTKKGLPDLKFSPKYWRLPKGGKIKDGILSITGNGVDYLRARCAVAAKSLQRRRFYFICEMRFANIVYGKRIYESPKLKIYSSDGKRFYRGAAENIRVSPSEFGAWQTQVLEYKISGTTKVTQLSLEIAMQSCLGVVEVRSPRLTFTLPFANAKITEASIFPFAVPSAPQCELDIKLKEKRAFNPLLLGVNKIIMKNSRYAGPKDPRVLAAIRQAPPLSVRFPGGTIAKWYDWTTDGWAFPDWEKASEAIKRKRLFIYNGIKQNLRFGFAEYAEICKEFAVSPILVFNVLYDSPEKNAARLKDRIARGIRPTWIELGNETYTPNGRGIGNIANIEDYVAVTKKIVAALRKVDPRVRLAVNANVTHSRNAKDDWNSRLAQETFFDGVVIHPYTTINPAYFHNKTAQKSIFGGYGRIRNAIENCRQQFPGKKVLLSEWGLINDSGGVKSFISVISTAEHIFAIIKKWEEGVVAQASNHQYIGGSLGLFSLDRANPENPLRKRRKGVLFELLWAAFRNGELYSALPKTTIIHDKYDVRFDNIPAINARALKTSAGKIKIFCVNKLPKSGTLFIKIDGKKYSGKYRQLIYKESITSDKTYALAEKPFTYQDGTGAVMLPSMSINMITLERGAP